MNTETYDKKKRENMSGVDCFSDYSFGREYEVSTFQLFTSFCNNLHLGQWELARSSIDQLRLGRDLMGIGIDYILGNIAENPTGYRLRYGPFRFQHGG